MGLYDQQSTQSNHAPKKKWKQWYMSTGDESDSNKELTNVTINGGVKRKSSDQLISDLSKPVLVPPKSGIHHPLLTVDSRRASVSPSAPVGIYIDKPLPSPDKRLLTQHFINPLSSLKGTLVVQPHVKCVENSVSSCDGYSMDDNGLRVVPMDSSRNSMESTPMPLNGMMRANGTTSAPITQSDRDDVLDYKDDTMRKRAGSTPSREVHNKLEKNRRAHLKECFEALRKQLPSMDDKKISNQTILRAAHRYIQAIKRKERANEHELERLARQKIAYQQQLATLKKELQSRWDHIDLSKIIPESGDQNNDKETKSTSSAPENPDYDQKTRVTLSNSHSKHGYFYPNKNSPKANNETVSASYVNDDQPLDLCTNSVNGTKKSPTNEWSSKRPLPYEDKAINLSAYEKRVPNGLDHSPHFKITTTPIKTSHSTNATHIAAVPLVNHELSITGAPQASRISQLVKAGTTISHVPPNSKVSLTQTSEVPVSFVATTLHSTPVNGTLIPQMIPLTQATKVSGTLSRITSPSSLTTVTSAKTAVPLVAGNGIQLPAQIMASGVHLSNANSLVSPSAIQVITPEGYKLLSTAELPTNGTKPVAITLAQPENLEQLTGEDGKPRSFMVSVNKNGVSTLHLTVPTTPSRAPTNAVSGASIPSSTVPLNLSVPVSSVESNSSSQTSIMPSYIPLTNSNGLARLMPGMSVVGPLVVSPQQRSVVVPTAVASKALKPHSVGTTSVSLVPTQYATSFAGGLVNSVVVMSGSSRVHPCTTTKP